MQINEINSNTSSSKTIIDNNKNKKRNNRSASMCNLNVIIDNNKATLSLNNSFIIKRKEEPVHHKPISTFKKDLDNNNNNNNNNNSKLQNKKDVLQTKIDSMLNRFKENQIDITRKKDELKRRLQSEELSKLKAIPQITRTSFKMENENFLNRMLMKQIEIENKKKILIEKQLQKKKEETKMNPKLNKKIDERIVQEKIDSMIKWESERKEKIKYKKVQVEKKETESCTFKPRMNYNSKKMFNSLDTSVSKSRSISMCQKLNKNEFSDSSAPLTPKLISRDYIELKRNLMKHNEFSQSTDCTSKELLVNVSNANNNNNNNINKNMEMSKLGCKSSTNFHNKSINIDPKILQTVSVKESRIIEELLKMRMQVTK